MAGKSIDELANDPNFRGLVEKAGFTLDTSMLRKADNELVIFSETHDEKERDSIAHLAKKLLDKHDFDSIGIEGFYGVERDKFKRTKRDISAACESGSSVKGLPKSLGRKRKFFGFKASKQYKSLLKRADSYGLEDEGLLLKAYVIESYRDGIDLLESCAYHFGNTFKVPDEIYSQITKELEFLRNADSSLGLPEVNRENVFRARREVNKLFAEYGLNQRNEKIADNISGYMNVNDSRKGIVIVGSNHVYRNPKISSFATNSSRVDADKTLPNLLQNYSILVIRGL